MEYQNSLSLSPPSLPWSARHLKRNKKPHHNDLQNPSVSIYLPTGIPKLPLPDLIISHIPFAL
jgi:hypothetical protein